MAIFKRWQLFKTKVVESVLYFDSEDISLFQLTIVFSHDGRVTAKRGLYISILGFTFKIFKPIY